MTVPPVEPIKANGIVDNLNNTLVKKESFMTQFINILCCPFMLCCKYEDIE